MAYINLLIIQHGILYHHLSNYKWLVTCLCIRMWSGQPILKAGSTWFREVVACYVGWIVCGAWNRCWIIRGDHISGGTHWMKWWCRVVGNLINRWSQGTTTARWRRIAIVALISHHSMWSVLEHWVITASQWDGMLLRKPGLHHQNQKLTTNHVGWPTIHKQKYPIKNCIA